MRLIFASAIALFAVIGGALAAPAIIGGEDAELSDFPYQVRVEIDVGNGNVGECGGSYIASLWILTAAHCVTSLTRPYPAYAANKVTVYSGSAKQNEQTATSVQNVYVYPQYSPLTNDIALLKLQAPLPAGMKQITLPTADQPLPAPPSAVLVSGWGQVSDTAGSEPNDLKKVTIDTVSNDTCNEAKSYNGLVDARQFCAGPSAGGKGFCHGDSGGSATSAESDWRLRTQLGIVSWFGSPGANSCAGADKYGVYTRVSAFVEWIDSVTGGSKAYGGDDPSFSKVEAALGKVSVIRWSNGKILIGGDFAGINNVRRPRMALLNADGTLDSFNPSLNGGQLRAVDVSREGTINVGIQQGTSGKVVRFKADGSTLTGLFDQMPVTHLIMGDDGSTIFFDGHLLSINFDKHPGPTYGFNIPLNGPRNLVDMAIDSDGNVLVLVSDDNSNWAVYRFSRNGQQDTTFVVNGRGTPFTIAVQSDRSVLIGGYIDTVAGGEHFGIGRVNRQGKEDKSFAPIVTGRVYALAIQSDGKIVLGGDFSIGSGELTRTNIARLNSTDGEIDTSFFGSTGVVYSLAVKPDNNLLVVGGGNFVRGLKIGGRP
jgi:uncharacterized delta-60 repeat protein